MTNSPEDVSAQLRALIGKTARRDRRRLPPFTMQRRRNYSVWRFVLFGGGVGRRQGLRLDAISPSFAGPPEYFLDHLPGGNHCLQFAEMVGSAIALQLSLRGGSGGLRSCAR
jgi:hypothetical protein